jgi:hypothetical protein
VLEATKGLCLQTCSSPSAPRLWHGSSGPRTILLTINTRGLNLSQSCSRFMGQDLAYASTFSIHNWPSLARRYLRQPSWYGNLAGTPEVTQHGFLALDCPPTPPPAVVQGSSLTDGKAEYSVTCRSKALAQVAVSCAGPSQVAGLHDRQLCSRFIPPPDLPRPHPNVPERAHPQDMAVIISTTLSGI